MILIVASVTYPKQTFLNKPEHMEWGFLQLAYHNSYGRQRFNGVYTVYEHDEETMLHKSFINEIKESIQTDAYNLLMDSGIERDYEYDSIKVALKQFILNKEIIDLAEYKKRLSEKK